MAKGYLGETPILTLDGTPFEGYGPNEWALQYIGGYGQIDSGHHKQWVLDQVARILKGTEVKVTLAKWDNGKSEYRYRTADPSEEYLDWVREQMIGGYNYDEGIAP